MYSKIVAISLVTLVVGGVIGYVIGDDRGRNGFQERKEYGEHMMVDGEMMRNDDDMSMADMMAGMNANLRAKTGDAFDQAFIEEMIVHHQGAVDMAELARSNASHQEIKDLAEMIISAQNKEIADMKEWQRQWFGEDSSN